MTLKLSKPLAQSALVGTRGEVRPSSLDWATFEVSPGLQEGIQKGLEKNCPFP